MSKIVIFFISIFLLTNTSFGQRITTSEKKLLEKKEDSLKVFAQQIINGRNPEERFAADSQFTKTFVRALQIKNSFYYPFDSLVSIAKVIPTDSSFKIFTWQLVIGPEVIRQHGAIQMKTTDGSLKLFPLIDKTDLINNIDDTITSNRAWIGALYYKIIEEKSFGKNVYTLLGFDDNNLNSDRKFIEILTFQDGEPVFGGPYFSFQDNSLKKKYTYIPDGDYEGLKWKDGKWVHIEKVFNQITPEGHEPVPNPILDEKGNIDESKLSNRMPENMDDSVDQSQQNQSTPPSKKKKK